MDEEQKKVYLTWEEKRETSVNIVSIFETFREVDEALIKCEELLCSVGHGVGYTSINGRLDKLYKDRSVLYNYIDTLPEYTEEKIDLPLRDHFRYNATERISRIHLEDFLVDNTLGVMETVYDYEYQYPTARSKEWLRFSDFVGTADGKKQDHRGGFSRTIGCVDEFAELFSSQYESMRNGGYLEEGQTFEEYWNQLLKQGEFYHDGSNPFENFVSSVLDITIIKPVIEAMLGEDLITGEDLSELERGLKVVFAAVDLATLGAAAGMTELAEVGSKEALKAMGKTAAVEFASNMVSSGVGTLGETLGLPVPVTILLSFGAGITVSTKGTELLFKGRDGRCIRKIKIDR